MFKMFSLVCSKTCQLRKLRQNECLLFNFCMIKLTKTPILPNLRVPNVFFWVIVNFITPKIEKWTLNLSQFSLVRAFFEGTRENILHTFWTMELSNKSLIFHSLQLPQWQDYGPNLWQIHWKMYVFGKTLWRKMSNWWVMEY